MVYLPTVPLGLLSSLALQVRAVGYGGSAPHMTVVVPALATAAPLSVGFPAYTRKNGDALSIEVLRTHLSRYLLNSRVLRAHPYVLRTPR